MPAFVDGARAPRGIGARGGTVWTRDGGPTLTEYHCGHVRTELERQSSASAYCRTTPALFGQ
jgi:hypothetical protein